MQHHHYSIIIPAYNEAARIEGALRSVTECIRERGWDAELLVVDDGSTDDTAAIVEHWERSHPEVKLIRNERNRGKGYSVRHGMLRASGDVVMFTDADMSSPIEEAERLFAAIAGGADVAIGSRWLTGKRIVHKQPLYRRFFGRCFNALTRTIMRLPFADTQCGFKAFRSKAASMVFGLQRIERWGFDPEILFIALRRGLRVTEVPVTWGHDERSRISYLRDGVQMLAELVFIRWSAATGWYNRQPAVMAQPVTAGHPK
ncbi:MAG: glycosyl transferase, group 2 family [Acidobacteriaceae bacterium]|nr:glycosyl transferase, group 2 family [Acidobacteriaceae bacterium]